jgi:hypothetical protein
MRHSGEVAPFASQGSTRAYTETIRNDKLLLLLFEELAGATGLEPATVTAKSFNRNQLETRDTDGATRAFQ